MTIADNYEPIRQLGNGSTAEFSADWSMLSADYARVFLENAATGVQTAVLQGEGADKFQIAITPSGCTFTMGTAPTSDYYFVGSREVDEDQITPYKTSRGFQGSVQEASYDKLTALAQQLSDSANRSVKIPLGDTGTLQLPRAALRVGKALIFDASGNVTVSADDYDDQATAAAASAAAASSSASTASTAASTATTQAGLASASAAAASVSADEAATYAWGTPAAWATDTVYALSDIATINGSTYFCVVAHTSGVFNTDLVAEKWVLIAAAGAAGSGTMASVVAGTGIVVDATDAENPIVSLDPTALAGYATLANPHFTGVPTTPTAAVGTNTTQVASCAFAKAEAAAAVAGLTFVSKDQNYSAVGSFCFCKYTSSVASVAAGSTLAGSALKPTAVIVSSTNIPSFYSSAASLTGTWRCLGYAQEQTGSPLSTNASLFQRIA